MKKNKISKLIKIVSFFLVVVLTVSALDKITSFKYRDGLRQTRSFYQQEDNTIDVLVLGSSHAFADIYPNVMWKSYGYSSFIFSSSVQPLWNTYFYLEEALKTQTPKVIVLEGYRLVEQNEYTSTTCAIKSTFGLKWSKTKIKSMFASFNKDSIGNYLFEFSNYHSRYGEVNKVDFVPYYNNEYYRYDKGEIVNTGTIKLQEPDVKNYPKTEKSMSEKTEEYYIRLLELAKENNIPVITFIAPYNIPKSEYGYYIYAEKIAEKYEMPFINCNELYDEIGLDFSCDFSDDSGHLSITGGEKTTKYLADFIHENYALEDHRGDEKYITWDYNSKYFDRYYYYDNLKEINDPKEYFEVCNRKGDYSFIIVANLMNTADEDSINKLNTYIDLLNGETHYTKDGIWVIRNGKETFYDFDENSDKFLRFDGNNDFRIGRKTVDYEMINVKDPTLYVCENSNDEIYSLPYGITVLVYDELFDRIVETVYDDGSGKLTRTNDLLPQKDE